jgi:hypothetical protein
VEGESEDVLPEERGSRGRRIWVIIVVLACLVGVGSWIAYGRQTKGQQVATAPGGAPGPPGSRRLGCPSSSRRSVQVT